MLTILMLFCAQLYAQPDISSGLKAYFPFNGNANDASGNGNNGTEFKTKPAVDRYVNLNSAMDFNSDSSSFISLPTVINGSVNGSISLWYYAYTWNPGTHGMFFYSSTNGVFDYFVFGCHPDVGTNELLFGIWDTLSGWQWCKSGEVPMVTRWYHIVATWGSSGMNLYVNGSLKGSFSYSLPILSWSTMDLIGCSAYTGTNMNAIMDELRVYDRILSSTDVTELYSGISGIEKHNYNILEIFPNPVKEVIYLTGLPVALCKFQITDLLGKTIDEGITIGRINASLWEKGIYLISLTTNDGKIIARKKLLKE